MSKRKGKGPAVTQDHVISTLTYIRTLVDALIAALGQDFNYSRLPPPLRTDIPYRKDCPPNEFLGKIYGKDCQPPIARGRVYGKDCPPEEEDKIYGKDCPPPEEATSLNIPARERATLTVVVPRNRSAKKKSAKKKV